MFKSLVGRGHAEFSSNRQQDASEFLLHLLSNIERAERAGSDSNSILSLFQYEVRGSVLYIEYLVCPHSMSGRGTDPMCGIKKGVV